MKSTRWKASLLCLSMMLVLALLLPGCTGKTTDAQDPGALVPVHLKSSLDLGAVEVVLFMYSTVDEKRSEEMMKLVTQQINKQRNISMQLQITYINTPDMPDDYVRERTAAGKPPQIAETPYWGRSKGLPSPLRLNEAIDLYGPNLMRQIPAKEWENWKVGDSIAAIPVMVEKISPCVYAKRSMLEAYGWQVPKNEQEFESLLQAAKAAGLCAIGAQPGKWPTQWFGIGKEDRAWLDKDGKVHPIEESAEYNAYLDTLRRWYDAGYYSTGDDDNRQVLLGVGNMDSVYGDKDAVPLPVISMAGIQPAAATVDRSFTAFECYSKPEALVTLLDWTYEDQENHTLISKGVKDTDWFAVGDNGYVWEKSADSSPYLGTKWGFQFDLAMDGFGGRPIYGCINTEGARQARIYAQAAEKPSRFLSIAQVDMLYALPDTTLYKVTDPPSQLALPVIPTQTPSTPAYQYTHGEISREDYDKLLAERLANRMTDPDPYLDLLQRILDKSYDPLSDMCQPVKADH